MFAGLTPVAQIIVSVTLLMAVLLLLLIIYKRGVKLGFKNAKINLSGEMCEDTALIKIEDLEAFIDVIVDSMEEVVQLDKNFSIEKKLDYVEVKLSEFQGLKESRFYKLLKDKGVPHDDLTSHPDAIHYVTTLLNAIFRDNGESGIKSMIRKPLKHRTYDKSSYPEVTRTDAEEKFIREFTNQVNERVRRYFRSNYATNFIDYDGRMKKRIVTNEEIHDMDYQPAHVLEMQKIFSDIFDNARKIDIEVNKKREELISGRKKKLGNMLSIRS
jgi:hypothetical protein